MNMATKALDLATCSDWELVCAVNHDENDLPHDLQNTLMTTTWRKQDGYGTPGFSPPQGWDWSAIRDSTEQAKKEMAQAIRIILCKHGITTFNYQALQ